ncbi:indole-3-glycerol phosphate synthase [Helicobacter cetorum]|uniref:indole-3-glycerol phosphate synthase n=1 Tax=Helicobacter cetorum TaxID=138563 RepID=UPI000CF176E2|nr:indole-3-glycerol phosphate synthase [Helicobacter cetorum]
MQKIQILENLKESLALKESMLSYEMLGKSLAYNPYLPRALTQGIKGYIFLTSHEISQKLLNTHIDAECIIVNFKKLYEVGVPNMFDLEVLGLLRRHASSLIIHNDYFISHYQLLESLIQGSDGVILDEMLLKEDLKDMVEFALRLGLSVLVETTTSKAYSDLRALGVLAVLEKVSNSQNEKKIVFLD